MDGFIGRKREIAQLLALLARVVDGGRTGRPGKAVLIRGRRRVGKSRLIEEFLQRAEVPALFFTASAQPSVERDLRLFTEAVEASDLPAAGVFHGQSPADWDAALSLLAKALPADRPSVLVLDEVPYLIAADPGFEGTLQKLFDREFAKLPVLLVLIGSDLAMMEKLNTYGRPFYQRGTEMVVPPLTPADVAGMVDLEPADAFDAFLVSGGMPMILEEWPRGASVRDYLADAVPDPTSALWVTGERTLAAEFPPHAQARAVLGAIGSGERTYALIGRDAGNLPQASLTRALEVLADKRMIETALPLSVRPSKERRYAIADAHLRFWLAFLGPNFPLVERGRGDLVLARIDAGWQAWRGRAVEPVLRDALWRLSTELLPQGTDVVGSYWTRTNDPEIDLVGADRAPTAHRITALGSIKWQEKRPFDGHDLARLHVHRSRMPGADETTPLLAVSRSGVRAAGVTAIGPADLLAAWR